MNIVNDEMQPLGCETLNVTVLQLEVVAKSPVGSDFYDHLKMMTSALFIRIGAENKRSLYQTIFLRFEREQLVLVENRIPHVGY
jgi:hypothetical protein